MRYGFVIPSGDIHSIPELAREAESAGWDGVFIPDCISIETVDHPPEAGYDPWIVLAAMALRTERVRLGTMLTPLARRRPWKLARETVTLDHLANGRMILPIGLGAAPDDAGFYKVGEAMDTKVRSEMLDEGLAVLAGLWKGEPLTFHGKHYMVEGMTLLPPPIQTPRIPIWVVGAWPRHKSMERVLRWDGLLPAKIDADGSFAEVTPADLRAMKAYIDERRTETTPFDIVMEGSTPDGDRAKSLAIVRPYADAGATWWMEAMWFAPNGPDEVRARIRQGPPRLEE
jgi:hypothetical protein